MKVKVGLQPFTIADELENDFLGSFVKVAQIGYQGVEVGYPLNNVSSSQLIEHFESLNLNIISCHVMLEHLTEEFEHVMEFMKEIKANYLVLSYHEFHSKKEVLETAEFFNEIGSKCNSQNIQFLYHHHAHEFIKFEEECGLDILIRKTNPSLVQFELDTYWIKKGGKNPIDYIKKLKNRCPLLHIKDMEAGPEEFFAEIGEGILGFDEIINAALNTGTEWFIVEQDKCRRNPMESIRISYNNLKKMEVLS
ncbi:sugar phosphate isomerase/epimerase family protein [Bacillus solitudinis]|uniref:sugar phosphate isomerase/epimerase family protein n=1 Tax=Bacillus solitudinis TaxID=2014074 RepID=UPI000C2448D8|nr:sugar phosphate isomerase/epimerase [Bacillus solitudinis]